MLNPANKNQTLPIILTGPKECEDYFAAIDQFIRNTLGEEATKLYEIIIDSPEQVARIMKHGVKQVKSSRLATGDAYGFNWLLKIDEALQHPFEPTHENMASLNLHKDQPVELLAADLRRAFSGIVAGNVKEFGMKQIAEHGRYKLQGDPEIMKQLDNLLLSYVKQDRMKLPGGSAYQPCYEICY
jgi:Predicted Rossmann fold nucleotide-binding protein